MSVTHLCVVDDDQSVRESLRALLRSVGYGVWTFDSAAAFLASDCVIRADCLVLDVRMPGMTGPELQRELARRGHRPPVVYITSYSLEEVRGGILAGARVTYLSKPFSESALLGAIETFVGGP